MITAFSFGVVGGLLRELGLLLDPKAGKVTGRQILFSIVKSLTAGFIGVLVSLSVKIFRPEWESVELIGFISGTLGLGGAELAQPFLQRMLGKAWK